MGSMHSGMDLSQFKKVKSDKKTTTLRHAKGHEIKIAHSGLTPKLKGMLDGLQMFAEKGDVEDTSAMDPDSPASSDDTADASPQTDAPTETPPTDNMVMQDAQNGAAPPPAPNAVDQIPSDADKGGNTVTTVAPKVPSYGDLNNESAKEDIDINQGHVSPQTLGTLFANKDTPGKIGLGLGLILSGAGSGLSHQPNALLEMLNQQMNRDLDAQKSSAANQQNFYHLNMQNELTKAQTANVKEDSTIKATTAAQNQMLLSLKANALAKRGMLTPDQQATIDGIVSPWVDNKIKENNANLGAQLYQRHPDEINDNGTGVDLNKMQDLTTYGAMGIPGMPDASQATAMRGEAENVMKNRQAMKQYDNAFKSLNTLAAGQGGEAIGVTGQAIGDLASALTSVIPMTGGDTAKAIGKLTDDQRATLGKLQQYRSSQIGTLLPYLANAATGSVGEHSGEQDKLADAMFPSVFDMLGFGADAEKTRQAKYNNTMSDFARKEVSPTLDTFHVKAPPPVYKYTPIDRSSQAPSKDSKAGADAVKSATGNQKQSVSDDITDLLQPD